MRRRSQADWLAIARHYQRGDATVQQICDEHGISTTTFYRHARAEGWLGRRDKVPAREAEGSNRGRRNARRSETIARLYEVLNEKMRVLEARIARADAGAESSAADAERDARTLSSLVRVFERLTMLEDKARASEPSARDNDGILSDAERLRRDLAQRLARLCAAGAA